MTEIPPPLLILQSHVNMLVKKNFFDTPDDNLMFIQFIITKMFLKILKLIFVITFLQLILF